MISRDSWQHLEHILDAALDLPAGDVPAWLDRACGGDADLRREVERLLDIIRRDGERPGYLDRPIDSLAGSALAEPALPLPHAGGECGPGQLVGPYRIVRRIGSGGMGVVYLAHDTRLDRRVALKLLPPALAADEAATRGLVEEARTASALDHPNSATMYDIGTADDAGLYIAMA